MDSKTVNKSSPYRNITDLPFLVEWQTEAWASEYSKAKKIYNKFSKNSTWTTRKKRWRIKKEKIHRWSPLSCAISLSRFEALGFPPTRKRSDLFPKEYVNTPLLFDPTETNDKQKSKEELVGRKVRVSGAC